MANIMTEIIAFHGWGLSRDFWSPWKNLVTDNVTFMCADRGYFDRPYSVEFNTGSNNRIVLAHSFGLLWCPPELILEADHLVIMSGFLHFHPEKQPGLKRSRLMLQQMMARFVQEPDEVLIKFYKNMFYPDDSVLEPPGQFNEELLLEDLSRMNTKRINIEQFHKLRSITILHGEKDKIVPNEKGREFYHNMPVRCQYFEIKYAGHALPYTHMWECLKFLEPVITDFE